MAVLIPTGQEVHDLAGHGLRVLGWSPERLGIGADVSPCHISWLETGTDRSSCDMVLQLAKVRDLEPRERNSLLVSAGFTTAYPATGCDGPGHGTGQPAIALLLAQ